jgi:protein phosphatase
MTKNRADTPRSAKEPSAPATPIPAQMRMDSTAARARAVRQSSFTPGQPIGLHLRVERQVRVTPERTWYLLNNSKPRWYTRKCWECGNKHSPATAQNCTYCQAPLGPRRFLMAAREGDESVGWQHWVERRLAYPAVAAPLALYRYGEQVLSIFPWAGENLLLGEPAPLPAPTLLSIAFQLGDALSFLHEHGVRLKRLTAGNVLIAPDGTARLFDLEVEALLGKALPATNDLTQPPVRDLRELAAALSHWLNALDDDLRRFLKKVQRGAWPTADALVAAISQWNHARRPKIREVRCAAYSDVGLTRALNEDSWTWRQLRPGLTLYAVADGMGGHEAGDVASGLATRTLVRTLERRLATPDEVDTAQPREFPPSFELEDALKEACKAANTAVWTLAGGRAEHMGTTLVALLVVDPGRDDAPGESDAVTPWALLANVGDSRAYRLREGRLEQISEDHSMVAAMVAAGKITAAEARNHPKSNVLLNFLGMNLDLEVDIAQVDLRADDRFLLCTDGLWGEVQDPDLARLLQLETDPRRAVHRLLRAANDGGGRDNCTVLVIDPG